MQTGKNSLAIGILCYGVWGVLPIYWNLLSGVNSLLILCCRIIFAFVCMFIVLAITGRLQVFFDTIKDKKKMQFLVPASILVAFNWGLFIYAVNSGNIMYSSLGYYMNPLLSFSFGVIIFKEKFTKLQLAAVALALSGVLVSVIAYGRLPIISLSLAGTFAVYGVLKKKAGVDPNVGIAIESLLMTPFALIFAFTFMTDSIGAASFAELLLLVGGGAATAIPLVLYARAVNGLPYITVGFLQYISPSLSIIWGLITGIRPTESQLVSFAFIGMGLVVFSYALVRINKKIGG